MPNLLINMLPAIVGLAKNAFKKENVVDSPTTVLAGLGSTGGAIGLMTYSSTEEAIISALITGASIIMFFLNEREL